MTKKASLNKDAFQELYERHANFAIRTAVAITRNNELAKDAVQETFIRVYRNYSSYNPSLPFEPWLYRILVNECNRLLKKEAKISAFHHPDLENDSRVSEPSGENLTALIQSIQSLQDLYRIPLILKYIKGFSEKEIAEILDINQNTVKSRLFTGRSSLRKILDSDGKEASHK